MLLESFGRSYGGEPSRLMSVILPVKPSWRRDSTAAALAAPPPTTTKWRVSLASGAASVGRTPLGRAAEASPGTSTQMKPSLAIVVGYTGSLSRTGPSSMSPASCQCPVASAQLSVQGDGAPKGGQREPSSSPPPRALHRHGQPPLTVARVEAGAVPGARDAGARQDALHQRRADVAAQPNTSVAERQQRSGGTSE